MKYLLAFTLALLIGTATAETVYRPYIKAVSTQKSVTEMKAALKAALNENRFTVVGEYQPAADANRWIFVVSHPALMQAVQRVGGLTGFAATLRVAVTREGNFSIVSYTTPEYWLRAYFREDYSKITTESGTLTKAFINCFSKMEGYSGTEFGSKKGLDADDLEDYNYMIGMPDFDDTVLLKKFASHQEAVAYIDANLKKGVKNVKLVSKVSVSGQNLTLYNLALSGDEGEAHFLPIIDIGTPKHTAFLPYEILVMGNQVHMLHGRFRIALSFPDLTMGTFTKIMSTPGNIEDLMKTVVQ